MRATDPILVGKRIALLRDLHGMSQTELARRIEVRASAISNWEQGTRRPEYDNVLTLCRALNVTSDYLLFGDERTLRHDMVEAIADLSRARSFIKSSKDPS